MCGYSGEREREMDLGQWQTVVSAHAAEGLLFLSLTVPTRPTPIIICLTETRGKLHPNLHTLQHFPPVFTVLYKMIIIFRFHTDACLASHDLYN